MTEKDIKHILVALDQTNLNRAFLQAATTLASQLNAKLNALFVEDINLLKLAELPFAREVISGTGAGRQISVAEMERSIQLQTDRMRKRVEAIAQQNQIEIMFNVLRGDIASVVCEASRQTDLLIMGKNTQLAGQNQKVGRITRTVLGSASCNLMLLQQGSLIAHPVAVFYTGSVSSQYALQVAIQLAQHDHKNLHIIYPAVSDRQFEKLRGEVEATTEISNFGARHTRLTDNAAIAILTAVKSCQARLLLIASKNEYIHSDEINTLITQTNTAVLLVN